MKYEEERIEDIRIIRIREKKLTSHEAPEMKTTFLQLLSEEGEVLVINLEMVDYMDSTGLGSFLFGIRQAQNMDKDVIFCGMQPRIQSLIRIARLGSVIEVYDTEQEALEAIAGDNAE